MNSIDANRVFRWEWVGRWAARLACAAGMASLLLWGAFPSAKAETDGNKIAAALGRSGTEAPGGVYRVGLPRTDLHVVLDGVELKPGFALGSWLAFRAEGNATMVMGDLVLTEAEIAPVMTKLAASGIEITALHNHLLRAQPATFYMHVLGHGDAVALATALHEGLALSGTPLSSAGSGSSGAASQSIDLDTAMIDDILGAKGRASGGVYQFRHCPRREDHGWRDGCPSRDGFGGGDQLPTARQWQSGDYR